MLIWPRVYNKIYYIFLEQLTPSQHLTCLSLWVYFYNMTAFRFALVTETHSCYILGANIGLCVFGITAIAPGNLGCPHMIFLSRHLSLARLSFLCNTPRQPHISTTSQAGSHLHQKVIAAITRAVGMQRFIEKAFTFILLSCVSIHAKFFFFFFF